MKRHFRAMILTLALLPAGAAWAHGGEDHGDHAPAAVTTPDRPSLTRSAATERFELVLTLDAAQTGAGRHVHLYLSDYATNAPVSGAKLSLDWGQQVTGEATATKQPGVYESDVTFPAVGDYAPLVTVTAAAGDDLITLDAIPVTAPPAAPVDRRLAWLIGGLILGAGVLVWWRRKTPAAAGASKAEVIP
jgi:hypothetical protein